MEALEVDQEASPLTSGFKLRWDVFLSFRGVDTRHNITSTLYNALVSRDVHVFKDNFLEEGNVIKEKLEEAITYSSSSVAIISKNYANSHWCLNELAMICEFGRPVFPVFYEVEPSEVKRQKGPYFEKDFKMLEKEHEIDKVLRWRKAMRTVGGKTGFVCNAIKSDEALIQSIVKRVLSEVVNAPIKVAPYLVGLDSHFEKLKDVLDVSSHNGIRVLRIHGVGGVGKTTLATALYNKLAKYFECRCFLLNVKEMYKHADAVHLQNKLINSLSTNNTIIDNEDSGILAIKRLYQEERVLLVLDDVENLEQLRPLAIQLDWISEGSRIIITSRNCCPFHANSDIGVEDYELRELDTSNSLRLFSYYAFRRKNPTQNLLKLSKEIVGHTGELPLTLEVFGSFLFDKQENQWVDALQNLPTKPLHKLQHILKISYEALDVEEQCVFLDIACLLMNLDIKKENVIDVLRGCKFSGKTVIAELMSRSLLKVTANDTLKMHDEIRNMGRQLVEENKSLGKRLWDIKDVISVLHDMKGSVETEGIILDLNSKSFSRNQRAQFIVLNQQKTAYNLLSVITTSIKEVCGKYLQNRVNEEGGHAEGELVLNTTLLKPMVNLRLLQFSKVKLQGNLHDLPSSLKWLQLKSCNLDSLAFSFCPEELGVLDLSGSKLRRIRWNTPKVKSKLQVMSLQSCREIVETPDFSMHHSLDKLTFEGCISLERVHQSITGLTSLQYLNFKDCVNLSNETFPSDLSGLKQLEVLILSGCTRLKDLPKSIGRLTSLRELLLGKTDIEKLPTDIFRLTKLEVLNLDHCGKLKQLPNRYIGKLVSLREMSLYSSAIEKIPDTIESLGNLEILNLMWCKSLTVIPDTIGKLKSLRKLFLDGSSVRILPESIGLLHNLNVLSVGNCCGMSKLPCSIGELSNLVELQLNKTPITRLPDQIRGLKSVKKLEMRDFTSLYFLPESLGDMSSLETLELTNASITYLPKSIGKLENLITLRLTECKNVIILHESILYLKKLQHLFIDENVERQLREVLFIDGTEDGKEII